MKAPRSRLLRHLLGFLLTLFVAVSLNFFLPRAMPGDPLSLIAGEAVRQMGAEKKAALREAYGLNEPLGEQYLVYLGRLARGDLGQSYRYSGGQSVVQVVMNRLGWTLLLVCTSLFLGASIGSLLGIWSARRRGRGQDLGMLTAMFTLQSIPPFWLAMIVIPIFAVMLNWFPSGDSYSFPRPQGAAGVLDVLHHAVLPILVLAVTFVPSTFAVMRTSMLEVLGSDYLRTARAKGLPEKLVLHHHAVRNTLVALITFVALNFGQMLGGAVLIETVFNYRGLGSMMFEAVKSRDYPLLQGGFLLFTLGVLLINLLVEAAYPHLDPRLRESRE
jgi:peptide/nickel transport system permease protein